MRRLTGFLLRREVVLAVFLLLKLAAVITTGLTIGTVETWGIGILALVTYTVIAWFAHQRRVISIWAATLIILYEGSNALTTGVEYFDTAPAIGIISFTVALYLVMGALVIFSSRHRAR